MAYLAWIASELGSATSFPKGTIIPQKPHRDASNLGRFRSLEETGNILGSSMSGFFSEAGV
jgi:hypothetical protein